MKLNKAEVVSARAVTPRRAEGTARALQLHPDGQAWGCWVPKQLGPSRAGPGSAPGSRCPPISLGWDCTVVLAAWGGVPGELRGAASGQVSSLGWWWGCSAAVARGGGPLPSLELQPPWPGSVASQREEALGQPRTRVFCRLARFMVARATSSALSLSALVPLTVARAGAISSLLGYVP